MPIPKDMTKAQLKDFIIQEAKMDYPWIVESLTHGKDEGDYSPELKHIIAVKELLEMV